MAKQRISIMKIKEIIRLHEECNLNNSQISRALKISRPSIIQYLIDYKSTGLSYKEIKEMGDDTFLEFFEKKKGLNECKRYKILSEYFPTFAQKLKLKGTTLQFLWNEYITAHPDGYGYSQFCYHYQVWRETTEVSMHMEYKAGDKMFVDYAGEKYFIIEPDSGRKKEVEIFIAILGASQLTYAEASENQKKENWIISNSNALNFFGGVPQAIVPDNLKSAVTKADKYDPDINPEYADFAAHYGTVIFPARPRRPKDKPLVENAVRLVYQRVYVHLRKQTFYSIEELNASIREYVETHNNRILTKQKISRRELFNKIEKDELKPLPSVPYELKNIAFVTIEINYHVCLREDMHYYSVPFYLRKKYKKAKIIYSKENVEIFHKGLRVAFYKRDKSPHKYTTRKEHMPPHHKYVAEWNPNRIIHWAASVGENLEKAVTTILEGKMYPEQAYKVCIGIIALGKKYGNTRVNNACKRAIQFGNYSLRSIKNILSKGLDQIKEEQLLFPALPEHDNLRGSEEYQ